MEEREKKFVGMERKEKKRELDLGLQSIGGGRKVITE